MALLLAEFPKEVPGVTVNRNYASTLEAVNQAAKAIIVGDGKIYIGSGVGSMSRAPLVMAKPKKLPNANLSRTIARAAPLKHHMAIWRCIVPTTSFEGGSASQWSGPTSRMTCARQLRRPGVMISISSTRSSTDTLAA